MQKLRAHGPPVPPRAQESGEAGDLDIGDPSGSLGPGPALPALPEPRASQPSQQQAGSRSGYEDHPMTAQHFSGPSSYPSGLHMRVAALSRHAYQGLGLHTAFIRLCSIVYSHADLLMSSPVANIFCDSFIA